MKKRILLLVMVLLFTLSLGTSALATRDYGVIYDETEMLGSDKLAQQGEQTLPQLTETLGLDLRVDVLTMISDDTLAEAAEWLYETYEYGYGEYKDGVSLTILLEMQDSGIYGLAGSDSWCVYVSLNETLGSGQELANAVHDAVQPYMAPELWSGGDISISADALTQAVDAMAAAAEDFILANCPPLTALSRERPKLPGRAAAVCSMCMMSAACSHTSSGRSWSTARRLFPRAVAAGSTSPLWTTIPTMATAAYTRPDYGDGSVYETTYQLYHNSGLGYGLGRDGIIVLLSMEERDYAMFVYGEYAEYAFNEYGREMLEERFLGNFGDNDWYGGISNYLSGCEEFLAKAEADDPVRPSYWPRIAMMTALSCLLYSAARHENGPAGRQGRCIHHRGRAAPD